MPELQEHNPDQQNASEAKPLVSELDMEDRIPRQALLGAGALRSQGHDDGPVLQVDELKEEDSVKSGEAILEDQMKAVLEKAQRFLDESGKADLVHARILDDLVGDLEMLDRQLKQASDEGQWEGNYLSLYPLIKNRLMIFIEHGQVAMRYDFDEQDRQARIIIADFQAIAESMAGLADVPEDLRSASDRLAEFAPAFVTATGMSYDDRALKYFFGHFGDSVVDSRVTVSDIESDISVLMRQIQDAATIMMNKARLKNQLTG